MSLSSIISNARQASLSERQSSTRCVKIDRPRGIGIISDWLSSNTTQLLWRRQARDKPDIQFVLVKVASMATCR